MRPPKRVEITCELGFSDDHALTYDEAKLIEKILRRAVSWAFPDHKVRACWVHRAPKYSTEDGSIAWLALAGAHGFAIRNLQGDAFDGWVGLIDEEE